MVEANHLGLDGPVPLSVGRAQFDSGKMTTLSVYVYQMRQTFAAHTVPGRPVIQLIYGGLVFYGGLFFNGGLVLYGGLVFFAHTVQESDSVQRKVSFICVSFSNQAKAIRAEERSLLGSFVNTTLVFPTLSSCNICQLSTRTEENFTKEAIRDDQGGPQKGVLRSSVPPRGSPLP